MVSEMSSVNYLSVMSFNVGIWTRNRDKSQNTYWKDRMKKINQHLRINQPDVICFQELWFPATLYIPKIYRRIPFTGPHHPIYIKKGADIKHGLGHFHFRWSWATVEGIRIINVHSHWLDKIYNRNLDAWLKVAGKADKVVITGDFNKNLIDTRMIEYDFKSARMVSGKAAPATFCGFEGSNTGAKFEIDHIFYKNLKQLDFRIDPVMDRFNLVPMSDHRPITADLVYEK